MARRVKAVRRPSHLTLAQFPVKVQPEPPWLTAAAFLEDLLADVKSGKVDVASLMLFYLEELPNGRFHPHYWTKNMSTERQLAFGQLIVADALAAWKTP